MKSIQGKEFELNKIVLYTVKNNQIYVLFDDPEQMKKYNSGVLKGDGTKEQPPIAIIPYTKENEYQIVSGMKQIKKYEIVRNENALPLLEVTYKPYGRKVRFGVEEESRVQKILETQRKISKEVITTNWNNLSEVEKEESKKTAKKNWRGAVAGILAAVAIGGIAWVNRDKISNGIDALNRYKADNDPINPTQSASVTTTPTPKIDLTTETPSASSNSIGGTASTVIEKTKEEKALEEYAVVANYDFTEKGKELYNEVISKDTFILKYQQVVNVNWSEEIATSVVEYINGKYPSILLAMSDREAKAKEIEIKEAWALLISGNLNPETTKENFVDLSNYAINERDRVLMHNADVISRNIADETIGEPMNGQILDEYDYASVNKFSNEYLGAADQLLRYEMATLNDEMYKDLSAGARWHIATTFYVANAYVPKWQTIELNNGEIEHYRYFKDEVTGKTYYAIPGENGTVDYRCDAEGKIYNEYEMYAMADEPMLEEDKAIRKGNSTIKMQGIQVLADNAKDEADLDLNSIEDIAKAYEQNQRAK